MMVQAHPVADTTVVTLSGQLDLDTAHLLRDALDPLLEQPVPRIVVDLAGLTFCDSIGLSALATGHNRCTDAGGYLRLSSPTPFLVKVLAVVGLTPTVPAYRTLQAACAGDPDGLIPSAAAHTHIPGQRSLGPTD